MQAGLVKFRYLYIHYGILYSYKNISVYKLIEKHLWIDCEIGNKIKVLPIVYDMQPSARKEGE